MATTTSAAVPSPTTVPKRRFGGDEVAYGFTLAFALAILAITILLVWELWVKSAASREAFGFGFVTSSMWNPVTNKFGALPFIYGTVITSLVALLISVPLGVGAAIYLSELAPPKSLQHAHVSCRTSGGRAQRNLRPAGDFHARSADAELHSTRIEGRARSDSRHR